MQNILKRFRMQSNKLMG